MMLTMQKVGTVGYLMTAWRIATLLLLVGLVGELAVTNRRLSEIRDAVPQSPETDTIEKKLDKIHQDLEDPLDADERNGEVILDF